jgi:small subunit ribosomal protein S18
MSEEIETPVAPPAAGAPEAPVGVTPGPRPPGPPGPQGQRPPPPRRAGARGRYPPRRRVCQFCVDAVKIIDYKDVSRLRRYLSDRAKIEPRRKTGTCAHHQRGLSTALKRARYMALLPYTAGHIRGSGIVLRG